MTKEELIEHARAIKNFCMESNDCNDCPFSYYVGNGCKLTNLDDYPTRWDLPEAKTGKEYVKIYCCGDCIHYNYKKHKCNLSATEEGKPTDHFYRDCPLGICKEELEDCEEDETKIVEKGCTGTS